MGPWPRRGWDWACDEAEAHRSTYSSRGNNKRSSAMVFTTCTVCMLFHPSRRTSRTTYRGLGYGAPKVELRGSRTRRI
eukprot:4302885-Pyramimonas_sp.AAC.1